MSVVDDDDTFKPNTKKDLIDKLKEIVESRGETRPLRWDLIKITDMTKLFFGFTDFKYLTFIQQWDVSHVTNMSYMFDNCTSFNLPLNNWNVSKVKDMSCMFYYCTSFNQPLNNWNVSKVENMSFMFYECTSFNQPLNDWNISHVKDMSCMFCYCRSFNQPLNNWNPVIRPNDPVPKMDGTFYKCISFNKHLNWDPIQRKTIRQQISPNVANQSREHTCWAFTSARVIQKFIKRLLPNLQTLSTDIEVCDKYYHIDKFNKKLNEKTVRSIRNTFVNNLPDFFKSITPRKCGEKEYKNLCLFMFIYFQLTNRFGCDGIVPIDGLRWFVNYFLNTRILDINEPLLHILPEPFNSVALGIMVQFHDINTESVLVNNLRHSFYTDTDLLYIRSFHNDTPDNMTVDFNSLSLFEYIKSVIDDNLYISLAIDLFGDNSNKIDYFNYTKGKPRPVYEDCKMPITTEFKKYGPHAMTIVDYIDSEKSVVIKNSWGKSWGENGNITIPVEELQRHCLLEIDYLSFDNLTEKIKKNQNHGWGNKKKGTKKRKHRTKKGTKKRKLRGYF